jgi:hypothetical protein
MARRLVGARAGLGSSERLSNRYADLAPRRASEHDRLTLSSRELLNQCGIVITGPPVCERGCAEFPARPESNRRSIHRLYLNARYCDAGIRHTDQSARAWERSDMICSWPRGARRSMDWDEYFRQQAAMYRKLAEKTEDAFIKQELLDLAAVCEEVANNIEDHQTSG